MKVEVNHRTVAQVGQQRITDSSLHTLTEIHHRLGRRASLSARGDRGQ